MVGEQPACQFSGHGHSQKAASQAVLRAFHVRGADSRMSLCKLEQVLKEKSFGGNVSPAIPAGCRGGRRACYRVEWSETQSVSNVSIR